MKTNTKAFYRYHSRETWDNLSDYTGDAYKERLTKGLQAAQAKENNNLLKLWRTK